MEVLTMMTCEEKPTSNYIYNVNGRVIVLNKDVVERFSSTVCPVDEDYLIEGIELFGEDSGGNERSDEVLSSMITTDMVQDLHDYKA